MVSKKYCVKHRLHTLKANIRILWLNILYGWTTKSERFDAFENGWCAVKSSVHPPENSHQHPVLKAEFESGALWARGDLEYREHEDYLEAMAASSAAIQCDEMKDVFHECRELGLVSPSGKILRSS